MPTGLCAWVALAEGFSLMRYAAPIDLLRLLMTEIALSKLLELLQTGQQLFLLMHRNVQFGTAAWLLPNLCF